MSLAGQIDTFHAFFGNLYVKSDKRGIISGSQTGYFPYNTAGRLLLATDARHKLFMTNSQTNTHHNLILYFLFHSQGNLLQCKFTELQDILGLKEIIECSLYFFRLIYLSSFKSGYQFFGRKINIYDLISLLKNAIGNTLLHFNTCDILHLFIHTLDVLNVDCRNHVNPFIKQCHHILPTFLIQASFHIGMCQFVYNYNFGMNTDNRFQIHLLELFPLIKQFPAPDNR